MSTLTASDVEQSIVGNVPCEYGHFGIAPCTGAVSHRITGCTAAFNACPVAAEVVAARMEHGDSCTDCHRLAGECWAIRPV